MHSQMKNTCVCSNLDLLRHGCICGFLTQQKKPQTLLPGDLITGIDRSYLRSIYQFVSVQNGILQLKLISYNGSVPPDEYAMYPYPEDQLSDFRLIQAPPEDML
jgi:hypothetical protein